MQVAGGWAGLGCHFRFRQSQKLGGAKIGGESEADHIRILKKKMHSSQGTGHAIRGTCINVQPTIRISYLLCMFLQQLTGSNGDAPDDPLSP